QTCALPIFRHDLQLGDGARPLAVGGADTVGAGVAAADDDDVLAFRGDGRSSEVAFLDPVGERQVFHGLVDAGEVAARDGQVPPHGGASGEDDGVVVGAQLVGGEVHADVDAGAELGAFGAHLGEPPLQVPFFQFEFGDAVAQQSADPVGPLVDGDGVPGPGELLGEIGRASGRERGRSGV